MRKLLFNFLIFIGLGILTILKFYYLQYFRILFHFTPITLILIIIGILIILYTPTEFWLNILGLIIIIIALFTIKEALFEYSNITDWWGLFYIYHPMDYELKKYYIKKIAKEVLKDYPEILADYVYGPILWDYTRGQLYSLFRIYLAQEINRRRRREYEENEKNKNKNKK